MKRFFIFFFTLCIAITASTAQNNVNQMDANGKRHGIWKKYYPGTKQLRYEGQFEHGKEVGTFKFYCQECGSKPTTVKEFNSKNNSAVVSYFTKKGKLVSKGMMEGKNRVGEWLYFHEKSKQVMSKETYVNGQLEGVQVTYYPDGKITEEITYVNGVKQGDNNYYSPEKVLLKKLLYNNDQLHGPAIYYDANGNVTIKGYYKSDKKHGLWQYYKDGKLELEETYPKPKKRAN